MKFDKSKILTCVTADQAKVGMNGWVADTLSVLMRRVKECHPTTIAVITGESMEKRFVSDANVYALFYPAPEPTIPTFNVGDTVVVQRGVLSTEQEIATVIDPCGKDDFMFVDNNKVRCGLKKHLCKLITYRPFNEDELNDLVGKIVRNRQTGYRKLVTGKPTTSLGVNLEGKYINAKDLLNSFMMDDGKSPCGIKE